jgi:hypothetical protein
MCAYFDRLGCKMCSENEQMEMAYNSQMPALRL